jgi:hypothetical protein
MNRLEVLNTTCIDRSEAASSAATKLCTPGAQ